MAFAAGRRDKESGLDITGNTKLVGILGDPVSHSLSPSMQNAAFAAMGLDMCYVPLHVRPDDLETAVFGLKAMSFVGANVTIPHKVAVVEFMDSLAESAEMTGAVNTIVNKSGRLEGHNTDGVGFVNALEERVQIDYPASPVLMAGAGGAARSLAFALAARGVPQIVIVNRTRSAAEELKELLGKQFPDLKIAVMTSDEDYGEFFASSKLIINATSLGMEGAPPRLPVKVDKISKHHIVCDIVYTRSEKTPLLATAKEKGATTLGGLGMLVHQGAAAIELWTGGKPSIEVMRKALLAQRD